MKTIALLRRGPAWRPGITPRDQPTLAEHRACMRSLEADGPLDAAGPVSPPDGQPTDLLRLVVFAADEERAAEAAMSADPAIRARAIVHELRPW